MFYSNTARTAIPMSTTPACPSIIDRVLFNISSTCW